MTLRTSLEASMKLKEKGIVVESEKDWVVFEDGIVTKTPQSQSGINSLEGHFADTIPAPSLDELLRHPKARESGIGICWEVGFLVVTCGTAHHECPDLQQALDFIAELITQETT